MTLEQLEQKLTDEFRKHRSRLAKLEKYYCETPTQSNLIECIRLGSFMRGIKHSISIVSEAREQPLPLQESSHG